MSLKSGWIVLMLVALNGCSISRMNLNVPFDAPSKPFKVGETTVDVKEINSATISELKNKSKKVYANLDIAKSTACEYRIAPGDRLMIVVWDRPDLNNPYGNVLGASNAQIGHLVDTKGYIYFPYVNNIYVAGLTTSELHKKLTENLTAYIKNPQVEVKILDYRGQVVSVQGAVNKTGYYPIEDVKNTLGQMIAAAGGYADKANLSQALLIRGDKTHVIDLLETYEDGTNGFNIRVHDKDTIKINYQSESNIYAFGAVSKPGAIDLGPHRINLRDAMATMNVTVGADLKQIYVLRRQDNTHVTIYHLDASSPVSLVMAGDFILRSNDIVYVQYNGSDQWASVMAFLAPFLATPSTVKTAIYNTENLFKPGKPPYRP